jgi:predicted house-cleaning noncanonical NTP pyrophosphatase (MazG superfamily)
MKKTFKFNKLSRDKTYQHMIENGVEVSLIPIESKKSIIHYFEKKILEEAAEVQTSTTKKECIEELADLLEVIHGFAKTMDITFEKINETRKEKRERCGGFDQNIIIESVTVDKNTKLARYLMDHPDRYPEINPPLD